MNDTKRSISWYAFEIQRITDCSDREAELLEEIVRRHVFHSPTLDWMRPKQFRSGALEALAILDDVRNAGETPDSWRRFLAGEQVFL